MTNDVTYCICYSDCLLVLYVLVLFCIDVPNCLYYSDCLLLLSVMVLSVLALLFSLSVLCIEGCDGGYV